MRLTRERQVREKPQPENKFKGRLVLATGIAAGALCLSCSEKPAQQPTPADMRCYDYENKTLRIYTGNGDGAELGKEIPLSFSQLEIKGENAEPLAYFCTSSGHLFWVTKDTVYVKKLSFEKEQLKPSKVLELRHIKPDEYNVPGVHVVSADVWTNPDAVSEDIIIATITNTGLFQAMRLSLQDIVDNKPDRFIYDLQKSEMGEYKWPEGVVDASVKVLNSRNFAIIPIGKKGAGAVRNFYNVSLTGNLGKRLIEHGIDLHVLHPLQGHPEVKNIIEISAPIRYDKSLGGWIVNLVGEKQNGETIPLFPTVTPSS